MSDDYFVGVDQDELERLHRQHMAWEPETRGLWSDAGFGARQHILDVGSGPGFTSIELSELVSSAGEVVALDKASNYLKHLNRQIESKRINNLKTSELDVSIDELDQEQFDGIFSRWFLAFVIDNLDRVLNSLYASLKPGGVLAAMEYLSLESVTSSPPSKGFDAHTKGWIDYYRQNGGDTEVGRYLPEKLVSSGFEILSLKCVGGIAKPNDRWWNWWGDLISYSRDTFLENEVITHELDSLLREDWQKFSKSKNAIIYTPILLQMVARKC